MEDYFFLCTLVCVIITNVEGTIHNLTLQEDGRKNVALSTFGFFSGGKLAVDLRNFSVVESKGEEITHQPDVFGFSLQKTVNDGVSSYMEKNKRTCVIEDHKDQSNDTQMFIFKFDLKEKRILLNRFGDEKFRSLKIEEGFLGKNSSFTVKEHILQIASAFSPLKMENPACSKNNNMLKTIPMEVIERNGKRYYSAKFTVDIDCIGQEGLYNLYFHNCANYWGDDLSVIDMEIYMIEHNDGTFLSAGEIPLPVMYGIMSFSFCVVAILWTFFLRQHRVWAYKIHWLMGALVYMKALSVAFHAVSFYHTGREGLHVQTWAILYYVIHLLKGALLFTTIVLIGTGYFFVKHVLSKKEKNLFMIVIPLQVIANVAQIIIESTEEGTASYKTWSQITIAVDLLCCGAILLPVIWSIKHLSEAAKTDGKAAISLQKLKLFRHFYVMIVCYIYFTRIVVYLIKITVPFQYMWLDEFFTEIATLFFYVMTGYKFRPANDNLYLHLPQEDVEDDIEMNDISEHSAYGERLTRVNKVDGTSSRSV